MDPRIDVADSVARFLRAIDLRDWAAAEACMTSPMHLDYSSFGAGDPADLTPSQVTAPWKALLPGFDHTHHQMGQLSITTEGATARVEGPVFGDHVIGGEVWRVFGRYDIGLERGPNGWQLARLVFRYTHQSGPADLPERARARAAQTT